MREPTVYEYKGYIYTPYNEIEFDGDCSKTFHDVWGPNQESLCLPLSSHSIASQIYFELWVDAGCPYPENQRLDVAELYDLVFIKITEDNLWRYR